MKDLRAAQGIKVGAVVFAFACMSITAGHADELGEPEKANDQRLESVISQQSHRLDEQDRRLSEQGQTIQALREELDALRAEREGSKRELDLNAVRATGVSPIPVPQAKPASEPAPVIVAQGRPNPPSNATQALPDRPVGEAPAMASTENKAAEVQGALPEGARVLTAPGQFVVEPAIEYSRSSSNRLVFRGVEIVPGIQLGLIDASDVARDTVSGSVSLRTGITDRIEVAARVPYYYRHDRVTVLSQQVSTNQPAGTQTTSLEGRDLGDIELSGRYQLNRGLTPGSAIFVGGLTVKSTTGTGPFDVNFDSNGIATNLATGSGFWAVSPNVTMLFPSDPVVLYATLAYNHNFGHDINKTIGTTLIGDVQPGDSVSLSMGFGFALNPQFSFSLGFSNTYVFASKSEFGGTVQHSSTAEVGSLSVGWSYVFSPNFTLSTNFDFGVTSDAPGLHVAFRTPFVL